MITAPLPRALPSGSGWLSMIIPRYYGLTITYFINAFLQKYISSIISLIRSSIYISSF